MPGLRKFKTEEWKNRLNLMDTMTMSHVSGNIILKTEQILRLSTDKELAAKRMVEITERARSEEEIMKDLNRFEESIRTKNKAQ